MDRMMLSGRVLFPDGVLRGGQVIVEDTRIAEVRSIGDAPTQIIAPGFIDLQINGAFGHDFTNDPETIDRVARRLPRTGVTAFLPTIITAPLEKYTAVFQATERICKGAGEQQKTQARILGLHLEGPYLSPQRAGAHNPDFLRARVDPLGDGLLPSGTPFSVRLMTLAPELENSLPAIRDLSARGVIVSIGHSAASYEQTLAAIDAGATYGTHLFNAMTPLHHRAPGALGALLADERVAVGVIADGVHVHPSIFTWLIKAKGASRVTLVTDAMAAAGLGAGEYRLGDRRVRVDAVSARLEDGTLAGSILTMDQAIRNLVAWRACSLADALTMASTTPARVLNLQHLGRIEVGCTADLVVLDEDLQVRQTIIGGEVSTWD